MDCPERRAAHSAGRRTVGASITGVALGASMLLGAGGAQAADSSGSGEQLIVDNALAIVDATTGQPVAVDPATMDSKVRQAVLLAMPAQFDDADDAATRFAELAPIQLDEASEGSTFYSGTDIAEAAKPHLSEIGLPEDKVDAVSTHFANLVGGGNGITVRAESPDDDAGDGAGDEDGDQNGDGDQGGDQGEQPGDENGGGTAPPPPPPEKPQPPKPDPQPQPDPQPEPGAPESNRPQPPAAPTSPQQLPAWLSTEGSDVPSVQPDTSAPPSAGVLPEAGNVLRGGPDGAGAPARDQDGDQAGGQAGDQERRVATGGTGASDGAAGNEQRRDVRAAGNAEAVPTRAENGVSAPVIIAAAALTVVAAGLVRTWVLRRS